MKPTRKLPVPQLILLLLVFISLLAGCGSTAAPPKAAQPAAGGKREQMIINIGTGTVGGSWYTMGGAMANVISAHVPYIKATAQPSNATLENLASLKSKKMEMGFAMVDFPYNMYRGVKNMPKDDSMRSYIMQEEMFLVVIVDNKSPYKTFGDLKGKRIGTGTPGSGLYYMVQDLLAGYGWTYNDVRPFPSGQSQQVEAFKDGNIDAFVFIVQGRSAPPPSVSELAATADIRFIPIDAKIAKEINAKYPYFLDSSIPVGWTPQVKEEVKVLGCETVILLHKDFPEDAAYDMLKALFDHKTELGAIHATWNAVTKENAARNLPVPLHPGAERYYKENGFKIQYLN